MQTINQTNKRIKTTRKSNVQSCRQTGHVAISTATYLQHRLEGVEGQAVEPLPLLVVEGVALHVCEVALTQHRVRVDLEARLSDRCAHTRGEHDGTLED